jgi:hypothetical protein
VLVVRGLALHRARPARSGAAVPDADGQEGIRHLDVPRRQSRCRCVGILAGDAICQARATAASLTNPTAFKAWLSDGTVNASARFTTTGPWSRIDGLPIATNLTDLLDGRLATTLDQTETGAYVAGAQVWTSTLSTGANNLNGNCVNWTAGAGTLGTVGRANNSDSHWTRDAVTADCGTAQRLYCFED